MASFTLDVPDRFPPGTIVDVYRRWTDTPFGSPVGAIIETETVGTDGTAEFDNLASDEEYLAQSLVGGFHVYVGFATDSSTGSGGGSGGNGTIGSATDADPSIKTDKYGIYYDSASGLFKGVPRFGTNGILSVVDDFGAKGDGTERSDGQMTSGSNVLTCPGRQFTAADIGKMVLVEGAGTPYNNRGAWATGTVYALGDLATYAGLNWTVSIAHTAGSVFDPTKFDADAPTSRPVEGFIAAVDGSGNALIRNASPIGADVNAGTTVTGAQVYFATNDSPAFSNLVTQCSVLGRKGWVPAPPAGTFYICQNTFIRSGVELEVAHGVNFRPTTNAVNQACFYLSNVSVSGGRDTDIHLYSRGTANFDARGTYTTKKWHGIFVGAVDRFTVDGFRGYGNVDANLINLYPTGPGGGAHPINGVIRRLRTDKTTFGFGPCQIDCAENVLIEHVTSDWNKAVNLEGHTSKTTRHITIRHVECNQRVATDAQGAIAGAAVGLIAHTNIVFRNIHVESFSATGGAHGINSSLDNGGDYDNVSIKRGRVTGGGMGLQHQWSSNNRFEDYSIEDVTVDGCNNYNASGGQYNPAFTLAEGMRFVRCHARNGMGAGWGSAFLPNAAVGTYWAGRPGRGRGVLTDCSAANNGQAYATGMMLGASALNGRGALDLRFGPQRIEMNGFAAEDNPIDLDVLTTAELDLQVSASAWVAGTGVTLARVVSTGQLRYLTMTSDGSSATMLASTPLAASAQACTAGTYYKAHFLGQQSSAGTVKARARIRFWDSGNVELTAVQGTQVTMNTTGTVEAVVAAVAPAGAVKMAMECEVQKTSTFTASDVQWIIPLKFGKARNQPATTIYQLAVTGVPTGGQVNVTVDGNAVAVPYNATAAQAQALIAAAVTGGHAITVGGTNGPLSLLPGNSLTFNTAATVVKVSDALTGGTSPASTLTTLTQPIVGQVYGVQAAQGMDVILGANCRLWGNQGTYVATHGRTSAGAGGVYREPSTAASGDVLAIA